MMRTMLAAMAAVLMLAALLRLGYWQLERARFKEALERQYSASETAAEVSMPRGMAAADAPLWRYRRARLRGELDPTRQYLLDNRTHQGTAGYHVLTPLTSADGALLVNRGWVPAGSYRDRLPDIFLESSGQDLRGRLVPPPSPGLLLGDDGYQSPGWPKVVQRVDLATMGRQLSLDLEPMVLLLDSSHPSCYVCDWKPVKGIRPERHRAYAFQWFALAAALLVISVIIVVKHRRHGRQG